MRNSTDEITFRTVDALRTALGDLRPEHDTPIGVVHPYWARKPMNVVETIIRHLSSVDDFVVDPFMGSGTTVFAALSTHRRAAGSDISPMAQHLVEGVLDLIENAKVLLPEIRRILDVHSFETLSWFAVDDESFIERERYRVDGDFGHGAFTLTLTEVVTKKRRAATWGMRTARSDQRTLSEVIGQRALPLASTRAIVDFDAISLPPNSRIAIPQGATLAQYFTVQNQASINVLLGLISDSPLVAKHAAALKLVLSASLPLLRLSDKKASSQWPYWRPKTDLTSRNPIMVLNARFRQIEKMVEWAHDSIPVARVPNAFQLLTLPAQELTHTHLNQTPFLVLTDPPYGDQVPYGEYAAMWNGVLDLAVPASAHSHELVRSDAQHRQIDSDAYLDRLAEAFAANATLLGPTGFLAWFYQDQDLRCWNTIYEAASKAGVFLIDVIPIPKQRRSLKTVTSPNTTLDGDLLCVFSRLSAAPDRFANDTEKRPAPAAGSTYFGRYAAMIAAALRSGDITRLADKYGTVKRALAAGEG
ncbi:hypothetical protein E3T23_02225 [Cryobacterium cheniae]|uniref:DNA methylase N-4/N-6 domain-containing protein n=1 Tax=Cryobacterium cheniae TaxID=1259262 RepID=A0A4R8XV41_9MICO|nr:DNA methyltransferase [Cryobacterium cheniae]TFC83391.1 hypothetical protein E3T23_02225 [Cryobacterium cheniae]